MRAHDRRVQPPPQPRLVARLDLAALLELHLEVGHGHLEARDTEAREQVAAERAIHSDMRTEGIAIVGARSHAEREAELRSQAVDLCDDE